MKEVKSLMTQKRLLNIQHGYNYRDIGGYLNQDGLLTKWHKIVRSGNLAQLSLKDQQLLVNYGVICDVDLRSKGEVKRDPDRIPNSIKYFFNPIHKNRRPPKINYLRREFSNNPRLGHQHMEAVYRHMIDSRHARRHYRKLFKIFLKYGNRGAILFHCSQGKDRTGMGVAMLLLALDVGLPTIKRDYLLSAKAMIPYIKIKQNYYHRYHVNNNFLANIKSLYTVSPDYINAAFDEIKKRYGTFDRFKKRYLHLNARKIEQLKNYYLMDPNR